MIAANDACNQLNSAKNVNANIDSAHFRRMIAPNFNRRLTVTIEEYLNDLREQLLPLILSSTQTWKVIKQPSSQAYPNALIRKLIGAFYLQPIISSRLEGFIFKARRFSPTKIV
jgi:hypothetical protein